MATSRREFLKLIGVAGAAGATGAPVVQASSGSAPSPEWWAMLVDLTLCIGCRKCEYACKQTNGFDTPPIETFEDQSVFSETRRIGSEDVTFVNRYHQAASDSGPVYAKMQCMHCNQPACASACPVGAIRKTPRGPVLYKADTCIGCRYCMMACPFSMLAYTYDDPFTPVVRKCTLCYETISREGGMPACAKICPVEAITFGKRKELITLARDRIRHDPDRYVDHIYGEHEVGGTGVLYLAPGAFDEFGFRTDLGTTPYPELTSRFMSVIPFILSGWPAVLLGIHAFAKRRHAETSAKPCQPNEDTAIEAVPETRAPSSTRGVE